MERAKLTCHSLLPKRDVSQCTFLLRGTLWGSRLCVRVLVLIPNLPENPRAWFSGTNIPPGLWSALPLVSGDFLVGSDLCGFCSLRISKDNWHTVFHISSCKYVTRPAYFIRNSVGNENHCSDFSDIFLRLQITPDKLPLSVLTSPAGK